MANINIAVWNKSTLLTDSQLQDALPAFQTQIHQDFAPVWGVDADLTFVPNGAAPTAGCWQLIVADNTDVVGDLGYHKLTYEGLPLGFVFAETDRVNGSLWSVTASHELLEMLADPDINLYAFVQTGGNTGTFYAYEVCDACELDEQGYSIGTVRVSDFVFPAWFEGFRSQNSTRFDHQSHIDEPFKLLPGGYSWILDLPAGLGWYQIDTPPPPGSHGRPLEAPVGSRRQRRISTRGQWSRTTRRQRAPI
jgi:hypothetical protein